MKAIPYASFALLMAMQISCAQNSAPRILSTGQNMPMSRQASAGRELAQPLIAVMPMPDCVLIAWKPVKNADGYFVYRETQSPASHDLLGIGPRDAEGFVDRDPPQGSAKYSVQAFKVSEISELAEAGKAKGATTVPSDYGAGDSEDAPTPSAPVAVQPVAWQIHSGR